MKTYQRYILLLVLFTTVIEVQEALAGPGGKILKELFSSPLGKIVGVVLGIILLPFIIYVRVKEAMGTKRTYRDLKTLAVSHPETFEWFNVKNRITEVFGRVHSAWRKEDMSNAAEWMTSWYWQNQQLMYLDRWQEQGLVNVCNVRAVKSIDPLHLNCSNRKDFEGTRLVASITANMEDYLAERESGNVVEGKKGYKDGETVWTFLLENGKWKAENIEEGSVSLSYAKLQNVMPTFSTAKDVGVYGESRV
jgi:hypothetical protein